MAAASRRCPLHGPPFGPIFSSSLGQELGFRLALPLRLIRFAALALATIGCVSQPATERSELGSSTPERPRARPRVECAEIPEATRLILDPPDRRSCPVVLVLADPPAPPAEEEAEPLGRWVALIRLPRADASSPTLEPLASGPAPLACGPELNGCDLAGVIDERHGPIVIAAERGHESEHPVQIHLGIHVEGNLAFVPSWYGESSVVDHTRIGPAYALAPFDCEGGLRLLPAARLPEAEGETVPAQLMMLSGQWWIGARGQTMPPQEPRPSSEGCTALIDPLP
jgi:hypothetical protein